MKHYFFVQEKMYWASLEQHLLIFTGSPMNFGRLHCSLFTNVLTATLSQLYLTTPGCSNNVCMPLEHVWGWNCKLYALNVLFFYTIFSSYLKCIHSHYFCYEWVRLIFVCNLKPWTLSHVIMSFLFVFMWHTINQTSESGWKKQQLISTSMTVFIFVHTVVAWWYVAESLFVDIGWTRLIPSWHYGDTVDSVQLCGFKEWTHYPTSWTCAWHYNLKKKDTTVCIVLILQ